MMFPIFFAGFGGCYTYTIRIYELSESYWWPLRLLFGSQQHSAQTLQRAGGETRVFVPGHGREAPWSVKCPV